MKKTSVYVRETERGREKVRERKRESESEKERMKGEGFGSWWEKWSFPQKLLTVHTSLHGHNRKYSRKFDSES